MTLHVKISKTVTFLTYESFILWCIYCKMAGQQGSKGWQSTDFYTQKKIIHITFQDCLMLAFFF